jgi:hypothetical protein
MPYTITEEKTYPHAKDVLLKAVLGAIEGLEGKVAKNDQENGYIEVKFPKTILGNVLGDRTQMELKMSSSASTETQLALKIYPINPVGQKLQFGARKGVPRKVMTWFFAHVDHRLKSE